MSGVPAGKQTPVVPEGEDHWFQPTLRKIYIFAASLGNLYSAAQHVVTDNLSNRTEIML
jgi:hypothetical protein